MTPPWLVWEQGNATQLIEVGVIEGNGACLYFTTGCFRVHAWASEGTTENNSWYTTTVRIDFSSTARDGVPFSNALREQIVKHEFGHALGLHERYPAGVGGCSNDTNEQSIMEGWEIVNGVGQPCNNLTAPTGTDGTRISNYYQTGYYAKEAADNTTLTGNILYSRWDDYVYAESIMNLRIQHSSSTSGPWTTLTISWPKAQNYHIVGIGGHEYTLEPRSIQAATDLSYYAGPRGKYYRVCAEPYFGLTNGSTGTQVTGTLTCSNSEWWPLP